MNLAQAYQGWSEQSQNSELFKRTKEAFRKAWFTLPTNKPCSYYTKEILGTALAETRVIESSKARAASVMCHVLAWANWAEPKYNPMPDFKFEDLMEYTKGPLADPDKVRQQKADIDDDTNDLDIDPVTGLPRKAMESEVEELKPLEKALKDMPEQMVAFVPEQTEHGTEWSVNDPKDLNNEPKTENNMEPKKTRGKQPRQVCQIDPKTLQVIHTYDSGSSACRITGAKNLDRAIKKLTTAGGYYWQYPEDVPTFAERLKQKQQTAAREDEVPVLSLADPEPEPVVKIAHDLSNFSDQELFAELERRGYQGELQVIKKVTIGTKNE